MGKPTLSKGINPYAFSATKQRSPKVTPGQTVALTCNIDADNITWSIGDIESL